MKNMDVKHRLKKNETATMFFSLVFKINLIKISFIIYNKSYRYIYVISMPTYKHTV